MYTCARLVTDQSVPRWATRTTPCPSFSPRAAGRPRAGSMAQVPALPFPLLLRSLLAHSGALMKLESITGLWKMEKNAEPMTTNTKNPTAYALTRGLTLSAVLKSP